MTRVAILWHMHQPFYQDLLSGEHVLPWVRLHALKDYWGMVALLREFPGVKVTFNLVPSLLVQVEAFARDEARDRHLTLGLKPADLLTPEEQGFCLEEFFHAHRQQMIDPYPRYRELLDRRGGEGPGAPVQASQFSVDDLRDLQVWHKLAWIDPWYHEHDTRIAALLAKGRGFTEEDKLVLRAVELELLQQVIPEYASAAARGQVELSTSPFYHPILPLLCDTDVYLRTHPHSRMPRERFRYPADAAEQIGRAVALHRRLFGADPQGLWPSEGSVSDAVIPLVADAGLRWMATDEEILARTRGVALSRSGDGLLDRADVLYRPYLLQAGGSQPVACGFRDHALSDLIGFTYASWSPEGAADDFTYRLVSAGRRYAEQTGGGEATIFVILDGENAWEHYAGQGRPFLRALYERLAAHPELRTVTMAEACAGATDPLGSIHPGSWINGDFYIWIGHRDDHRAWSQLADARRTLDAASTSSPERLARAREEILIAEGSDWFWWYGDDHSSDHDREFDELFRRHLRNVYRALERPIPEELFVSNITTVARGAPAEAPTGFIEPAIDGRVTDYFEWTGAGFVGVAESGGTMHRIADGQAVVALVEYGFSLEHLFIRLDGAAAPMEALLAPDMDIRIKFLNPAGLQVVLDRPAGGPVQARVESRDASSDRWQPRTCEGLAAALGAILEVRIPFGCLHAPTGMRVAFVVVVNRAGGEVEQHPREAPVELEVPDKAFPARTWTA